jgi:cold shock protein
MAPSPPTDGAEPIRQAVSPLCRGAHQAGLTDRRRGGSSSAQKGSGFIAQDGGAPDAFVHISAVQRGGLQGFSEGQRVEYDLVNDSWKGKSSAENLKAL